MDQAETAVLIARALRSFLASPAVCAAVGALQPARFSAQMLREDPEGDASAATPGRRPLTVARVFHGLRGGASYVDQLAGVLCEWRASRTDPVTRRAELERSSVLPRVPTSVLASGVISVDASACERVQRAPIELLDAFVQLAERHHAQARACDTESELNRATHALVDALGGARGLLTLLGHSRTAGSVAVAPLTRTQCVRAFQRRRSEREPLSVGARALAKHCQRAGADSAWGPSELRGNDASKNARALAVLEALLDDAVWKNVHALPPFSAESSVVTMEVRDSRGYGARWEIRGPVPAADAVRDVGEDDVDVAFRGFLEPPMADGHERRWRH